MGKSPLVLIIMVLCLMGAYFYYLHIKKRDAENEPETEETEVSAKKEAPAEKPVEIPTKMPWPMKIFITLLAVYTAYLLVDSLLGAYSSLAAGQTIFLSLAFVFLPASLRLLTIAFALKKKKLFRITYIAAVAVSIVRFFYYSIVNTGTVEPGVWIIIVFYAAWIVYIFRSKYVKYGYADTEWKWKKENNL